MEELKQINFTILKSDYKAI